MRTEAAPFILAGTLALTACTKKNETAGRKVFQAKFTGGRGSCSFRERGSPRNRAIAAEAGARGNESYAAGAPTVQSIGGQAGVPSRRPSAGWDMFAASEH
jgi:hypothetical protein